MDAPISLKKGQTFASFEDLKDILYKYGQQEKEIFRISWCNEFNSSNQKHVKTYPNFNDKLVYFRLVYKCKFGDDIKSKGHGQRATSTCRLGCKAFITINLSNNNECLHILDLNLIHNNHTQTKTFFHMLPENRLNLPDSVLDDIKEKLNVKGNKKAIQKNLNDQNVFLSLKDLTNIKSKMKSTDGDNLQKAVDYLVNEKDAIVEIFEEDNIFKALFFCTDDMLQSLKAYPEILFIDGTYKLLQLNFTVVVILIEDGNGSSEVVAIGLFVSEDIDTYRWFLNTVKKHSPEACQKVKCIMSDKDTKERSPLSDIFKDVPLHICRFHTLQIFKREFPKKHSNNKTIKEGFELLQKLVYSASEEIYFKFYAQLKDMTSDIFMNYYDEMWHNIREEWTEYGMVHRNLGNLTNNRLESINQKFKSVIEKQNSLIDFFKRFFDWKVSHNFENDFKLSKCFTTKRLTSISSETNTFSDGIAEMKYEELLTKYALDKISPMFEKHQWLDYLETDEKIKKCKISSESGILTVTTTSCECSFVKRHNLPCHHIFATRKMFNLPLYDENLCDDRWKKAYVEKNNRIFDVVSELEVSNVPVPASINSASKKVVITKARGRKTVLTVPEKRTIIKPLTDEILDIISTSCGRRFEIRKSILKDLCELWKANKTITLCYENSSESMEELNKSVKDLSISEKESSISDVKVPKRNNVKGRPSKFLDTTTMRKSKRAVKK